MRVYQRRMLKEEKQLRERIVKLERFLISQTPTQFSFVPTEELNTMHLQLSAMKEYHAYLMQRINRFSHK